jgi:TolB-like protein/DNA-binding winged helix-turn-helix (wHTH) protein/tetratricopeptide (TPR) repeat protein
MILQEMARGLTPRLGAAGRTVCFGAFEFDPQSGELRKHGLRIKLQGQPIELLTMLVQHPGEVVTREDLQKRLWPGDTYVDFEHSLNAAMKRLRAALGDSADAPRFIETLARRGYRFIAPLNREQNEAPAPSAPGAPVPGRVRPRRRMWAAAIATTAAITVAALLAIRLIGEHGSLRKPEPSRPIRSLAVLPLANFSGDPAQDDFAEGITDALRQHLEGIGSLRVISRTSSMHYRGSGKRLPQIARELNTDAVVDGSVKRSGGRVRLDLELMEASADRHLWSNSYEGDVRDIFVLQAQVAGKIADEIGIPLTPPERARLTRVHTLNPDAYQAYAKGRFYWNKRTLPDLTRAIGFFQEAVDKDPDYALAYDGLADSWLPLGWYGFLSPAETFPHAKAAVARALELDDSLAAAHTSLAFVNMYYERDWAGAEREFRRALELNVNYANGHHWYAEFLSLVGRHERAIEESQRARELDPLSNIINAWVSSRYLFAGQYDKAIEEGRSAVEMDPNFAPSHLVLGQAYEQKGMLHEAISEFARAVNLTQGSSMYQASLAHALGRAGRRAEAAKALADLRKDSQRGFVSSYDLAVGQTGLGDKDRIFELLGAAVRERSPRAVFLNVDPRFNGLHSDSRFGELVQSIGLR